MPRRDDGPRHQDRQARPAPQQQHLEGQQHDLGRHRQVELPDGRGEPAARRGPDLGDHQQVGRLVPPHPHPPGRLQDPLRNGKAPFNYELGPKDVAYVGENETVRLITKFAHQTGRYMIHCHNLPHEDHDMMTQFRVGTDTPDNDPMTSAPATTDRGDRRVTVIPWARRRRRRPPRHPPPCRPGGHHRDARACHDATTLRGGSRYWATGIRAVSHASRCAPRRCPRRRRTRSRHQPRRPGTWPSTTRPITSAIAGSRLISVPNAAVVEPAQGEQLEAERDRRAAAPPAPDRPAAAAA